MAVAIVKSTYRDIKSSFLKAFDLLEYKPGKEKIVLKPNAGYPGGSIRAGDCVSTTLLRALAEIFKDREVIIAEGVAAGMDYQAGIRNFKYDRLPKKYSNVRLVDLEKEERIPVKWKHGELKLPKILYDCEYINIAKMKTHYFTYVSLCMKNQKGALLEKDKRRFHMIGLQDSIYELSKVLRPDLNILDAIVAMDGNGPYSLWRMGGRTRKLNTLICGKDIWEVDNVALQFMQLEREKTHVPDVPASVVGEKLSDVRIPLQPPNLGRNLRMGNFNMQGLSACSGCMQSFLDAMKLGMKWPYVMKDFMSSIQHGVIKPLHLLLGPDCAMPPEKYTKDAKIVCIGVCTRDLAKEHDLPLIRGCPPAPEEIRKYTWSMKKLEQLKVGQDAEGSPPEGHE
ncbi:MAG: DUF362 domain-containing protein [Deltaproteobacteria bacterium]|nr:MAG: DUF362 domain-containing protein [Deltaproteobacteria bacterium]